MLLSSVEVEVLLSVLGSLAAAILLLLGFTIGTRALRESAERGQRRFRERWEPVLHARMAGDRNHLPGLKHSERAMFLGLWLHLLGYVHDEAAERLNGAARELGLEDYVLQALESGQAWLRILAMRAAGALRLERATGPLVAKAGQARPHSSLSAVRALLQIRLEDGLAALQALLGHLEWSPLPVADIFRIAGPEGSRLLATMIGAAPPGKAKQLIRVAELVEDPDVIPALRERLLSNRDDEEIAVILHALGRFGSGADRLAMRSYLSHPAWLVRVQAAAALGLIGIPEDHVGLLPLVHDPYWWVRYRAAQSLLKLLDSATFRGLRDREPDHYAREMLDRVLAEQE